MRKGSGDTWMVQFTWKIIEITHGQWLFRNFTLHSRTNGYLLLQKQEEVLATVVQLVGSDPADVPAKNKFLLEMDHTGIDGSSQIQQEYWVAAVKATLLIAGQYKTHQASQGGHLGSRSRRPLDARPDRINLYCIG